jgi:uncharacterized protein (DUF2164 family)
MIPAELTAERRDEMVEKTAHAVVKRRLETVAVAVLEMHKPLATIGSTVVMFFTPLAAPFVTLKRCDELAYFLLDRDNIEKLASRIEELARERDTEKGAAA